MVPPLESAAVLSPLPQTRNVPAVLLEYLYEVPEPVPGPGIDIDGYRAIVEREDPFRKFEVDLPASQTSVTIPSEFVEPGTDYKIEVQSIERSGNQTISEIPFRTGQ